MKKSTKAVLVLAFILAIGASFWTGGYLKERANLQTRQQRCNTLISFAIDKAVTEDLSDQNVMEALMSNVYAAYQYCDEPALANQLHDLWNTLIFDGETYIGNEEALMETLRSIASAMVAEQ